MISNIFRIAAVALAVLPPMASIADPLPAPVPAPIPRPFTVTNVGPTSIVRLSVTPSQGVPSNVNQLTQPVSPFAQQPITISTPQQCCYDIKATYSDGHTVTIPNLNISNVPIITIRYGGPPQ